MQNKINEYTERKAALEIKAQKINTDIILTQQSITQQETIFMEQFGTKDITELQKLSDQYQLGIVAKEHELAELEKSL